jgi:sigma-B regulation protein RsbU (phosphoserine phosphatase)
MVENELRLEPGDLLVLYTDGITEAANKDKQRFGLERLQAIVGEHARAEASAIGSRVLDAARAFTPRQEDDMTIVVLRQR